MLHKYYVNNWEKHSTHTISLTKSEIVRLFHLEDIQEPLTPREFTRCAITVVSRWCDNVLTGRYSSVESVGSKLDCLERIYKNR